MRGRGHKGFKRQRLSKDRSSITAVPQKYQVFIDLVGREWAMATRQ